MYFIFEMNFSSPKNYIANLIRAYIEEKKIDVEVLQTFDKIILVCDKEDEDLESFS